ncbi:esterase/lipase family protein, partial [Nanoarchaeota archaeon]
ENAVLMVHGLGSSPEAYNDVINDIRLTRQPWQAWTFGYPSDKSNVENAKAFADEIEANVDKFENIYVVAHSLGAIVSQQALNYAYTENMINPGKYTFINKVRKSILIGAPNDKMGGSEMFFNLARYYVNLKTNEKLFNPNSRGVLELLEGNSIPRVPFIKYYVIAGTRPYEFNTAFFKVTTEKVFDVIEPNDGIVTVRSAQHIGDTYINNSCENYFEIDGTHTDLIENPDSRIIIEKIIATEILKDMVQLGELGKNKYYKLHVNSCSSNEKYVIIGKRIKEEKAADPSGCSCGNGYCGVDEDETTCPVDCARFFRKENICSNTAFFGLLSLILLVIVSSFMSGLTIKSKGMLNNVTNSLIVVGALVSLVTIANMLVCFESYVILTQSVLILVMILALSMLKTGKFKMSVHFKMKYLFFDADKFYSTDDVNGARRTYNKIIKLYEGLSPQKQAKYYKTIKSLHSTLSKKEVKKK